MMYTKLKYPIAFLLLSIIACNPEEVDLDPPSLEVLSYLPEPIEADICSSMQPVVFLLKGGDELSFDALFTDDTGLSQFKVDIHNNFDCHGHGGGVVPAVVIPTVDNQTTDWSVLEIQDISGTSQNEMKTLNVPENVTAGNYHFHIQVIDESGNDSPFANFHSLKITNPLDIIPPQINVEEPSTQNFSVNKGEAIQFVGEVTDNRSLSDGANGVLYLAYTDLSSGNTFTTDKVFPFDETVTDTYAFDFEYVVPQTLVTGDYRFSLGSNDGVRNVAPFLFFEVSINQ